MIARRRVSSFSTATASNIGNLLVVASIAKALAKPGGSQNLDGNGSDSAAVPLSEDVVLQVLRRNSLDVSKRLDFFRWCSLRPDFRHSAATYSQIFKTVCGCRGYHGDIFGLLDSMSHDGANLDSATFKLLLDSFIRVGKFDTALEILEFVGSKFSDDIVRNCLSNDVYNSVLIALVHKNQVKMALSIFLKLLESSNSNDDNTNGEFVEDALACNELLVGLKRAEMRAQFKQVFDKLRERKNPFPLDRWGYNICIHTFGLWGNLATSLMLFKEMKERGNAFTPDLCTYNSLIQVLCVLGKVKDALVVWEEMKGSSGLEPDYFTYRILIQGCSRSYRVNDAMKIFSEMQYNGLCPDTIVYNSLLNGLLKARKLTDACNLFEKMIEDDGVRASCWTYNILIDGLFKNGRAVAAYTLFCDLKKKSNSFVDGISYSIVVLHLCREGGLDKAMELVEEMEARGFAVDLVTITSLLITIYREGRWDWMERLMKHIRDKNLVPIVLRWRKSMEAMLEVRQSKEKDFMAMFPYSGDFTDILRVGDSVETEAYTSLCDDETDPWSSSPYMDLLASQASSGNFSPHMFTLSRGKRVDGKDADSFDMDMVNTFLSIFLAKGKLSLACKLFEIFTNTGADPVSYTYNSMMSSFVKKGYFNEAWGVLREMGDKVCPADIATYNVIIQGLGKMGRADLASAVLDRLMKQGGYLDIVMYNTLINTLGKAGRIEEANKLFQQMKSTGINPDVVTYNTLIEVHSKAGRLKEAYKFLKIMLDAGCVPNNVTDTILDFLEKEIEKVRYQKASIKGPNVDASL
ncbi:PREDICTED: pentatricopeptide repeat-containing protein At4g01570 [Ipomoea nil]|uniref:pentatricopeptide repeat-containing protein At4g01570 n=1 Tax=Ipomoea nil TaxID=35883 RepID=UPI000901BB59|nr:PREDICTED: pentatricopeptide repeat-containing protein At4g01570 [Ipomoea nil]